MEIILESELKKAADFKKVDISQFAKPIKVDEEKLERMLLKYRTRFAEKKEAETVQERDLVTLSMESENPRFCKQHITARIGLGMLTRELEQQLIGLSCGEKQELTAKDSRVSVTIEKVVREIVPELTDELVRKAGEKGRNCRQDVIDKALTELYMDDLEIECDDAFAYVSHANMEASEYHLSEAEREIAFCDIKIMMGDKGMMTDEQIREMADGMLFAALMGQKILKDEDGLYTDEDYERYLVEEAGRRLDTPEHIRAEVHPKAFVLWEYSTVYMDRIEDWVAEELVRLSTKGE